MISNKKTFEKSDWEHYVKLWPYGHDAPIATISRIKKKWRFKLWERKLLS